MRTLTTPATLMGLLAAGLLALPLNLSAQRPQPETPDPCASGHEFATTDCALTWHGITLYGAYDAGVGWSATACRKTAITTKANPW